MDRPFLIFLDPNHVDEVAWLWPRSLYIARIARHSVLQAIGLGLVILHQGFALGEPETGCGGWSATNGAPFRSRRDHEIRTESCRTTGPSWSGRSVVGRSYLLIRLTLNQTYQSQGFGKFGANPIDGVEQVGVVDLPPFVARKRTTG